MLDNPVNSLLADLDGIPKTEDFRQKRESGKLCGIISLPAFLASELRKRAMSNRQ